jgi:hypothetical protein
MISKLIRRLMSPLNAWTYRKCKVGEHDGICIADVSLRKDLRPVFAKYVNQALDLVAAKDSRRYRRIRKNLRFIVHKELARASASYRPCEQACFIDLGNTLDRERTKKVSLFLLAGSLVHEATHAEIFRRGAADNRKNAVRMERICVAEQTRFASRVNATYHAACKKVFSDKSRWDGIWQEHYRMTAWQRVAALWRRRSESRRRSNKTVERTAGVPPCLLL